MTMLDKMLSTAWEKSMEPVIFEPGEGPSAPDLDDTHPAGHIPVDASMINRLSDLEETKP